MTRPVHPVLWMSLWVAGCLALIVAFLFALDAVAAPDKRRLTTFSQDDGTITCSFPAGTTTPRCSDGRAISTVRATTAPCETAPGVWTDVGVNQACVSVRGLESWGAVTNYLGHTNEAAGWTTTGAGITFTPLAGETGFRATKAAGVSGLVQTAVVDRPAVSSGETWTRVFDVRAISGDAATLVRSTMGIAGCTLVSIGALESDWRTVATTCTTTAAGAAAVGFDLPSASGDGVFDFRNVRLVKSSTPGRPVWCGTAPCTVAADDHRITTNGWPVDRGRFSLTFTLSGASDTGFSSLVDADGSGTGFRIYIAPTGVIVRFANNNYTSAASVAPNVPHNLSVVWGGGNLDVVLDGVKIGSRSAIMPSALPTTARIGGVGTGWDLQGSISRLSWSNR